jgi:hypothetical protein
VAGCERTRAIPARLDHLPRQGDVCNAIGHVGSVLFWESRIVAILAKVYEVAAGV